VEKESRTSICHHIAGINLTSSIAHLLKRKANVRRSENDDASDDDSSFRFLTLRALILPLSLQRRKDKREHGRMKELLINVRNPSFSFFFDNRSMVPKGACLSLLARTFTIKNHRLDDYHKKIMKMKIRKSLILFIFFYNFIKRKYKNKIN